MLLFALVIRLFSCQDGIEFAPQVEKRAKTRKKREYLDDGF